MVAACCYLRSVGVVHKDLKLENFLLSRKKEDHKRRSLPLRKLTEEKEKEKEKGKEKEKEGEERVEELKKRLLVVEGENENKPYVPQQILLSTARRKH